MPPSLQTLGSLDCRTDVLNETNKEPSRAGTSMMESTKQMEQQSNLRIECGVPKDGDIVRHTLPEAHGNELEELNLSST